MGTLDCLTWGVGCPRNHKDCAKTAEVESPGVVIDVGTLQAQELRSQVTGGAPRGWQRRERGVPGPQDGLSVTVTGVQGGREAQRGDGSGGSSAVC